MICEHKLYKEIALGERHAKYMKLWSCLGTTVISVPRVYLIPVWHPDEEPDTLFALRLIS